MGCCWPSRNRDLDQDLGRNNKKDEDQPLIDNKKSPNGGKGKGMKKGKAMNEPNPFHKPSKSRETEINSVVKNVSHLMSNYRRKCYRGDRRREESPSTLQCE